MSDFGPSGDSVTSGDLWRYLWLGLLALLVLVVVLSQFEGGLLVLLALLLAGAALAGVLLVLRGRRS